MNHIRSRDPVDSNPPDDPVALFAMLVGARGRAPAHKFVALVRRLRELGWLVRPIEPKPAREGR